MLTSAIIFITGALIFYTAGVWGEKISGGLKPIYLILFWLGLLLDSTGTTMMSSMSVTTRFGLHAITGALAIILMIFHAIWASIVLIRKNEKMIEKFHRFSFIVWLIWLIPYFSGVFMNM